jgi:hypothetical protein
MQRSPDPPRNLTIHLAELSSSNRKVPYLLDSARRCLRARSASPTTWRRAYQSARVKVKAAQHHHHEVYNDFIQIPLAGTYRHLEHMYGAGNTCQV